MSGIDQGNSAKERRAVDDTPEPPHILAMRDQLAEPWTSDMLSVPEAKKRLRPNVYHDHSNVEVAYGEDASGSYKGEPKKAKLSASEHVEVSGNQLPITLGISSEVGRSELASIASDCNDHGQFPSLLQTFSMEDLTFDQDHHVASPVDRELSGPSPSIFQSSGFSGDSNIATKSSTGTAIGQETVETKPEMALGEMPAQPAYHAKSAKRGASITADRLGGPVFYIDTECPLCDSSMCHWCADPEFGLRGRTIQDFHCHMCAGCTATKIATTFCCHELKPIQGMPPTKWYEDELIWCSVCPKRASFKCVSGNEEAGSCALKLCADCGSFVEGAPDMGLSVLIDHLKSLDDGQGKSIRADAELLHINGEHVVLSNIRPRSYPSRG